MNNKQAGLPKEQVKSPGLESLEQAPANTVVTPVKTSQNSADNFSAIQKRPTRPWKKQVGIVSVMMLIVAGLGFAAFRLNARINQSAKNQDLASSYKQVGNPVLGEESVLPVQSLNDKTVTINGDLTVSGKLNLSAQALNDLASILGNTVQLSPVLGGPAQAGNINISGGVAASNFQGNGANLSDLNASSITSGTLSNERLDASVTRLGQTIPLSALQSTVLSSLNGISNNGAASIVGSGSVTVSTDVANGIITIDSVAGDITGVAVGSGLTGGGTSGDVTLDIDTGIVTVQGNTFNGANQLVKLGSAGELPVINATNLTNLNASNIASGTLSDSRLSANVTVQGNTFNGNSQLVKLNGAGELPALSATNLTNLNASNIGTGTLNDSRLGANVTLQGNTFNLANKLVQLDNSGNLPTLNGSAITNLNASNVASGTLNDSRLSANVALLNANQTFSGNITFSQPLSVNVIQPSAAMTIGATNQALTLQGDLTSKLTGTGGTGTVSLGFTGTPVGNIVYQLDASAPAGTYTLCTTVGNCAGSGDGVTSLGGATNKLAKFTGSQAIGDSSISDDGLLVTVGANALYKAGADSTTAFRVQNAAGSTNVFTVDSTNTRVAIGQSSANYTLDVNGDINSATGLRVGGNLVCDANGCSASGSSGFYIQNSATTQTSANFNIESTSTSTPTAVLKLKTSQTADLLQAKDASNNVIAKIDANGNISTSGQFQVSGTQISSANLSNDANLAKLNGAQTFSAANLFRNASDSTTAFRIQNAAASNLFVADTSNSRIAIGQATAGYTLDVNGDINITTGSSYRINGVAICGPTATCAPSSGSGSYVQNGLTVQTANVNIQSSSSSAVVAVLQGATSQSADILQARDSNDNVVAKITASGAIYQGTNQVCDTSNNCGYAVGSGSGNYIQNNTNTQTANMNIKSASASQVTAVIQGANAQTADILQVKDNIGNNLLSVNQLNTNLISNPSFESDVSGWTASGTSSRSRVTTQKFMGDASMAMVTGAVNDRVDFVYPLAPSTTYSFSMYLLNTFAGASGRLAYSNDGSTFTDCSNFYATAAANINKWSRLSCSFTTSSSVTASSYVSFRSFNAGQTFYIDAVQLELGGNTTAYQQGSIALNGVVGSPTSFRNSTDSTTAFQIQNATGTNMLTADTVNNKLLVANAAVGNGLSLNGAGSIDLVVGGYTGQIKGSSNAGGSGRAGVELGYAGAGNPLWANDRGAGATSTNAGTSAFIAKGASGQTADIFQVQGGNTTGAILSVGQSNTNLITNPSFDVDTTGWLNFTSTSGSRVTSDQYSGQGSLLVSTSAANAGLKWPYTLAASATYSLSMYVKAPTAFSTFEIGYTNDGTNFTSCATAQTVTASWSRITCTFTMSGAVSGSRFIYFRQTDSTARSFLVDAVQLESGSAVSNYSLGSLSLNGTVTSPAVFKNQSDSSNAFQIQNSNGSALFTADTANTPNLIVNPSFDLNTSGWTAAGAASLTRSKADSYSGESSMLITTTAAANDGAVYNYALAASTTYTFSMYARAIGAQWGFLQMYFTNDGSTAANCANNLVAVTGGWTRYTCTFTVVASPSGTRYVGIRQTDATARGFYVDAVQLEASSSATSYSPGAIALNGRINSPVAIQGQNNSTTAFTVQNAAGTSLLNVDSLTSMIRVGTNAGAGNYSFFATDAARLQNVIVGGSDGASTLRGASGSGGTINLQNAASQSFAFTSYANTTATNVFQFNATPSSVENLMQIQRNGTAVATFGNTGALQLKNSTDSGNAFQIQNAAGAVALNVSTAVNSTTAWAPTTNFSQARIGQRTVTNNGYMYILGGRGRNDVQYAKFNSDGSLGGWITTSSFTTGRNYPAAVAYNGYMYIMGGDSSGGVKLNDVQYAQINADGSLGSWTTTSSFTTGRQGLTGAVYNGYIYILGGETPTKLADTQYAVINPNGTIGSWTATTNLPNAKSYFGSFVSNGYVYAIGGLGTSTNTEVAYAPLNGNGTIGTWATTTPLTTGRYSHGTTVANGRVYVLGGYNGGNLGDVLSAPLNGNGTVGSWTAGVSFSGARYGLTAASNNGYLYIAGGQLPSNSVTNDVQFLSLSAQSVSNSLSFNGSFNNTGPASFQNGTNSINAFSVQDASATSIFQVDTSNGRVGIMNSSPGNLLSVGALTTADPDGVLAVGTGAVGKKGIVIQAVAGQTADLLQAQDSTGVVLAKLDKDGNLTVKSITVAGHIITSGPVPNMSVIGSIAGSSPTSTNYGTDVAGLIVLTTDSDATGGGDFIRIDFANPYSSLPVVVLSPSSEAAAELSGTKAVYAIADTDGFTISVGAGGLDPSLLYGWSYHVIQ